MIKHVAFLVLVIIMIFPVHAHSSGRITLEVARLAIPENVVVSYEDGSLSCSFAYEEEGVVKPVFSWYENNVLTEISSHVFEDPVPGNSYVCNVFLESEELNSFPVNSTPFVFDRSHSNVLGGSERSSLNPLTGFATRPSRLVEEGTLSGSTALFPIIVFLVIINAALIVQLRFRFKKK